MLFCGNPLGPQQWTHSETDPIPGQWQVQIDGGVDTAYLLAVRLDSPLQVSLLQHSGAVLSAGDRLRLRADARIRLNRIPVKEVELHLSRAIPLPFQPAFLPRTLKHSASISKRLSLAGSYSLLASVRGRTRTRSPFERSFIRSLIVTPRCFDPQVPIGDNPLCN